MAKLSSSVGVKAIVKVTVYCHFSIVELFIYKNYSTVHN